MPSTKQTTLLITAVASTLLNEPIVLNSCVVFVYECAMEVANWQTCKGRIALCSVTLLTQC